MLEKILNKLLPKEDIARGDDGLVYLRRWTLFRTSKNFPLWKLLRIEDIRVYIHKFMRTDITLCLHDHPNSFLSFILWHAYDEEYWNPKLKITQYKRYKAPTIRYCKAAHTHRVSLIDNKPCWSLVIMFVKMRQWGFWTTNHSDGKRRWWSLRDYEEKFGGTGGCE